MDAATPETSRLSHCVKAMDRFAGIGQDTALQIGLEAAKAFSAENELADRDQGPRLAVFDCLERAGAQAIPFVLAKVGDPA